MSQSILIATPAYGGLLYSKYVKSLVSSCNELAFRGIVHGLYIIPNESLISRARNRCATFALNKGFDKLLFIDADLGWEPDDFSAIIGSDRAVVGGTYPLKQIAPVRLSFNPLENFETPPGIAPRSAEELRYLEKRHADPATGELEVRHVPTGFMLIDCSVFRRLQPFVPRYVQENSGDGTLETQYDYFPVRVSGQTYESEDWAFCSLVREHLDCGVWLNSRVVLNHTGVHTFAVDEAEFGTRGGAGRRQAAGG